MRGAVSCAQHLSVLSVGGDVGVLHSSTLEPASQLVEKEGGEVGRLFLCFSVLKKKSCNFVIFFYLLNHLLYYFVKV